MKHTRIRYTITILSRSHSQLRKLISCDTYLLINDSESGVIPKLSLIFGLRPASSSNLTAFVLSEQTAKCKALLPM